MPPTQFDLSAPVVDIKAECGKDWTFTVKKKVNGTYVDFSGFIFARLMVRRLPTDVTPIVSLDDSSGITINNTAININLPAQQTSTIPPGVYSYDLRIKYQGIVDTIIRGSVEFIPEIS